MLGEENMTKSKNARLFMTGLTAVVAVGSMMTTTEAASENFFPDVSKENALYPEILDLHKQGVIKGFLDGTFRPHEAVTRGQAAKILADMLKLDTTKVLNPGFKDVPQDKWYYGAIAALVQQKIVSGFTDKTYRPDQTLTRAEVARMISEAYKLQHHEATEIQFTDVAKGKWYYTYIQTLVENKVTSGKTKTTFMPDDRVTRGELAAFVSRANKANGNLATIEAVENGRVTINGETYQIADSLNGLFNGQNSQALKNAKIKFTSKDGTITSVESLALNSSGSESAHAVLDAGGAVISGSVSVNGNYVELKNVTINGNLTVTENVTNSFISEKLTVKGVTKIEEAKASAAEVRAAAAAKTKVTIVFKDSTIATIEIAKEDVQLSATGSTKVESVTLHANANILADQDVIIPKINIQDGVTAIEINATIKDIFIESNDNLKLTGDGNIENVVIHSDKKVSLETTGEIKNLESKNKNTQITVGEQTKISNISLPEGKKAEDVVENFDKVKNQIEKVDGSNNPDYSPSNSGSSSSSGSSNSGSGGGDQTAPVFPEAYPDVQNDLGTSVELLLGTNENSTAYYVVLPKGSTSPSAEQVIAGKDSNDAAVSISGQKVLTANAEGVVQISGLDDKQSYDIHIVAVDSNGNQSNQQRFVLNRYVQTEPGENDQTAPFISIVSAIDNNFDNELGHGDQINLFFSEKIQEASRNAIKAELEAKAELFGESAQVNWISDNRILAITLGDNSDISLNEPNAFSITKANLYDEANNIPESDVTVTIPDHFALTGDVYLGSATTTKLTVKFAGSLAEETRNLTEVSQIIKDSNITKTTGENEEVIAVSSIEWNEQKAELTLTIPETTLAVNDRIHIDFVLNAVKNVQGETLGGITKRVYVAPGTEPNPTEPPKFVAGVTGIEDQRFSERLISTGIPLDWYFEGVNLQYSISVAQEDLIQAELVGDSIQISPKFNDYDAGQYSLSPVDIKVKATNEYGSLQDEFQIEFYPEAIGLSTYRTEEGNMVVWQDSRVIDVTGYQVYRNTEENFEGAQLISGIISNGTESFIDTELEDGVDYFYFVRPVWNGEAVIESDYNTSLKASTKEKLSGILQSLENIDGYSPAMISESITLAEEAIEKALEAGWQQNEIEQFDGYSHLVPSQEKLAAIAKLDTPSNLVTNGTTVSWDAVENAATYEAHIYKKEKLNDYSDKVIANYIKTIYGETSIDLSLLEELNPGIYQVRIIAIGEDNQTISRFTDFSGTDITKSEVDENETITSASTLNLTESFTIQNGIVKFI